MKTIRFLVFRAFLLVAFLMSYLYFLYGQERGQIVPIVHNMAWNDLVTQIKYMPDDSPQESLFKEVLVIQKFLSKHQTEESVTDYDIAVFRAIDQVRARLQKADKNLETIRKELSYKEQEARRGRYPWGRKPSSTPVSASGSLSQRNILHVPLSRDVRSCPTEGFAGGGAPHSTHGLSTTRTAADLR